MFTCFRGTVAGVLLSVAVGGCASAGEVSPESQVSVQVENDLIPPTTLSVYAISQTGNRRLLGVVRPSETTTLRFVEPGSGTYRFVAETTAGAEIVSSPVLLGAGDGVVWVVNTNVVVPM